MIKAQVLYFFVFNLIMEARLSKGSIGLGLASKWGLCAKKFMKIKPKLDNTIEGEKCAKTPLDEYLSDPLINCLLYHFGAFKEVSLI